jgi:hypothetical protein
VIACFQNLRNALAIIVDVIQVSSRMAAFLLPQSRMFCPTDEPFEHKCPEQEGRASIGSRQMAWAKYSKVDLRHAAHRARLLVISQTRPKDVLVGSGYHAECIDSADVNLATGSQ